MIAPRISLMTPAKHFLLGFLGSVLAGAGAVAGVFSSHRWLERHGIQPMITALIAFLLVTWAWRWFFRNFVGLPCPKCHRKAGYEMPGTHARFRCHECGTEF